MNGYFWNSKDACNVGLAYTKHKALSDKVVPPLNNPYVVLVGLAIALY